ncbi:type III secretion system protein PrgI [Cupriavidus sp. UYMSc13B]|nr:type III secretion system protein PrgI [Cupriavidus sp. UYMSc13B]
MIDYLPGTGYKGYIEDLSSGFDAGINDLSDQLKSATEELQKNPSNPVSLAKYQGVISDYNIYRMAQSSAVRTIKEIDSGIISNYR